MTTVQVGEVAMRPTTETASLPSPAERRQRNRQEVRAAILEAARDVMREQGVAALSLREVARRVHLQAPSLYAYFPSKMAIYDALFLIGVRHFAAHMARGEEGRDDFWDWLHALFENYLRFAQENPELHQLVFERPIPGFVPTEESLEESFRLLTRPEQMLADGVASGQIVLDMPIPQARDLIFAMAHGLTSQHMANEPHLPVGSGRFGSLIPAAVALFRATWNPEQASQSRRDVKEPVRGP
jgi:AcrR family transcriptional regulator